MRVRVNPCTLSVTHIFDGEEVVSGGDDCQVWVATFACPIEAQRYIANACDEYGFVTGERREE